MKKFFQSLWIIVIILGFAAGISFAVEMNYKAIHPHIGGDVTPLEAWEMIQQGDGHIYLVDCRTRAEYQLIGHAKGAYNIPYQFWTGKFVEKKYGRATNSDFGKDLLERFDPKQDTLIIMCRSASRSCKACNEALKAGWPEDKIFNMLGGFEGGKFKAKGSIYDGWRRFGGWRNAGLPWTYNLDRNLVYKKDLPN